MADGVKCGPTVRRAYDAFTDTHTAFVALQVDTRAYRVLPVVESALGHLETVAADLRRALEAAS